MDRGQLLLLDDTTLDVIDVDLRGPSDRYRQDDFIACLGRH